MKKLSALALALAALSSPVQASVITLEAANATSPFLVDAAAYLAAVDAALAGPSYASQMVASYNAVSHQGVFGGNTNFALKSTITFGLSAASNFAIRAGVDFGFGGAMFLDGVAVDFKSNDMWWNGSYANASQIFSTAGLLAAGNHTLTIVGFEGCCDGNTQVQFKSEGGQWTSFGNTDGLNEVPEPASMALVLAGAGLIGLSRRRARAAKAA